MWQLGILGAFIGLDGPCVECLSSVIRAPGLPAHSTPDAFPGAEQSGWVEQIDTQPLPLPLSSSWGHFSLLCSLLFSVLPSCHTSWEGLVSCRSPAYRKGLSARAGRSLQSSGSYQVILYFDAEDLLLPE